MDDLIRRSDVLDLSYTHDAHDGRGIEAVDEDSIMSIPAVDAVEVRHSYWEDVVVEYVGELTPLYIQSIASMRCASCNRYHNEVYYCGKPKKMALYCPYCGDRMDGRREDGDT